MNNPPAERKLASLSQTAHHRRVNPQAGSPTNARSVVIPLGTPFEFAIQKLRIKGGYDLSTLFAMKKTL